MYDVSLSCVRTCCGNLSITSIIVQEVWVRMGNHVMLWSAFMLCYEQWLGIISDFGMLWSGIMLCYVRDFFGRLESTTLIALYGEVMVAFRVNMNFHSVDIWCYCALFLQVNQDRYKCTKKLFLRWMENSKCFKTVPYLVLSGGIWVVWCGNHHWSALCHPPWRWRRSYRLWWW